MKRKLLTSSEIQSILTHFNIGKFVSKFHIDVTIENQNYRIVTNKGPHLLKLFEEDAKLKDLEFQNNLMEYLYH